MKRWFLAGLLYATPILQAADAPAERIDLLSDPELKNFSPVLNVPKSVSLEAPFTMGEDGILRVNGAAFGYFSSKAAYRDYHLVLEYKWGEHTWGKREDSARDAGVFIHAQADGKFRETWPLGIEVQLIEGATGNINQLGDKEKLAFQSPEGPQDKWNRFPNYRSADWKDQRGFRGTADIEEPVGEWNRLEVICRGSGLQIKLNGKVVNLLDPAEVVTVDSQPTHFHEGRVALQSEWAEWFVRRWELYPLDTFEEPWDPKEKSHNTGSGADLLPREQPLSIKDSLAAFEIDGPFEIQLVAAEPVVSDPVDVVWDHAGRMFVAEMRDYPLPPEHGPLLSRIRLLNDEDGDGVMDAAKTWADHLDHVQGLLPVGNGLLATTRTSILFLEDTNGDETADKTTVLFESNDPRHSQLQISCPRWGVDGWIYLNNGLDGKEIYPEGHEDAKLDISRRNIRLNPHTWEIEIVSGYGQFGATLDDWGRRFASTNRNPTIFAVMPLDAVTRNPFAALTIGKEDIAPFGGDATVYPKNLTHTTAAAHLGTHTAACGLGVYRGSLVPELQGDVFVCEPPGQLVTRAKLIPNGASMKAERVRIGERTEFLRSSDEWFRPVNLRNGPDGALYVCDMYRRFIDHSRFFPEEFSQEHYMRAGFDHGRIYRIVPKGGAQPKQPQLSEATDSLLSELSVADAWRRDRAQRLLIERGKTDVVPELVKLLDSGKESRGRLHALWTLHWLAPDTLTTDRLLAVMDDAQAEVVENAIELAAPLAKDSRVKRKLIELTRHDAARVRFLAAIALGNDNSLEVSKALSDLAKRDYADPWMRNALLSGGETRTGIYFEAVASSDQFRDAPNADRTAFLNEFAAAIARRGDLKEMEAVFNVFAEGGEKGTWWQLALVDGLAQGLKVHKGDLGVKNLGSLLKNPPESIAEPAKLMAAVTDRSAAIALDSSLPIPQRLAAIPMLQHMLREEALPKFAELIESDQPPQIRNAAFGIAGGLDRNKLADLLFERWTTLDPNSKSRGLELLVANTTTAKRLMEKMKEGEINPALMDTMSRWRFQRSTNEELKALADSLFGQPSGDRAEVMQTYHKALENKGSIEKGQQHFTMVCSVCHIVDGVGNEIGPDITDVRNKPAEALLSDILDPNRAVEARWTAYTVETTDGRTLLGLVVAETADSVTLKGPGINETLPRSQIKSMTESGQSLMPVGLEAALSPEQMSDLLAYLRER